jgi:hypothetical protein
LSQLFATGVVDTCNKFPAGIADTSSNLTPVPTTTADRWQNLPQVSLIPVANLLPLLMILVVYLDLRKSPRIKNNSKMTLMLFQGLGGMIHEKNLKQKSCDTIPLSLSWLNKV